MAVNIKNLSENSSELFSTLNQGVQIDQRLMEIFEDVPFAAEFENFLKSQDLLTLGTILGEGSFGTVFSAEVGQNSPLLGNSKNLNKVAIKVVSREKAQENPNSLLITKERLGGEGVALSFPESPHLLKTFSLITYNFQEKTFQLRSGDLSDVDNEHILAIVMEKLDGYSEVYERDLTTNIDRIKKITKEVLRGLQVLHDASIAHRDIKVENIMYNPENKTNDVKIIDYNLSKDLGKTTHKRTKSQCGSFRSVPPEILHNEEYNQSVDIYSLGASVYAMAFNRVPFQDEEKEKDKKIVGRALAYFKDESSTRTFREYHNSKTFDKRAYPLNNNSVFWDFLKGMLESDPQKRFTAKQALEHPFLQ